MGIKRIQNENNVNSQISYTEAIQGHTSNFSCAEPNANEVKQIKNLAH
jgi:hypothetical protein